MDIREMHYDFKQKLNKLDSQKYRNLKVPEIDWKLQEAQEVFVKLIAEPRVSRTLGFEINQRSIDDIRSIVVNQSFQKEDCLVPDLYDESSFIVELPGNYWFYIPSQVYATKGQCKNQKMREVREIQHDDEAELSPFDRSSFEWRVVNIRFIDKGIRIFTDGSFNIDRFCLNYIKTPQRIHNAQDAQGGSYKLLDGTVLTGFQNCELPPGTHREIVDLAVLISAGDLSLPDYMIKQDKVKIVNS